MSLEKLTENCETNGEKALRIKAQNDQRDRNAHSIFINRVLIFIGLVLSIVAYKKSPEIYEAIQYGSEIEHIIAEEGWKTKRYKDTKGIWTIGVGHRMLVGEKHEITDHEVVLLLHKDYSRMRSNVEKRYPWARGDVKLLLVNMSFQMGETGLSRFKNMLVYLEKEDYNRAAAEAKNSKWGRKYEARANRIAGRILKMGSSWRTVISGNDDQKVEELKAKAKGK